MLLTICELLTFSFRWGSYLQIDRCTDCMWESWMRDDGGTKELYRQTHSKEEPVQEFHHHVHTSITAVRFSRLGIKMINTWPIASRHGGGGGIVYVKGDLVVVVVIVVYMEPFRPPSRAHHRQFCRPSKASGPEAPTPPAAVNLCRAVELCDDRQAAPRVSQLWPHISRDSSSPLYPRWIHCKRTSWGRAPGWSIWIASQQHPKHPGLHLLCTWWGFAGRPALSSVGHGISQQTQNICITFVQCWTNVENVGPTLYKCYTNVLCLLGYRAGWCLSS